MQKPLDVPGARLEAAPGFIDTDSNNFARVQIRSRGPTTYILRTNVPIGQARVLWTFGRRSAVGTQFARSGRYVRSRTVKTLFWGLPRDGTGSEEKNISI